MKRIESIKSIRQRIEDAGQQISDSLGLSLPQQTRQTSPRSSPPSSTRSPSSSPPKKDDKSSSKSPQSPPLKSSAPKSSPSPSLIQKSSSVTSLRSVGMGVSRSIDSIMELTLESSSASGLIPEGGSPMGETLYDCICFVFHCYKHNNIAVSVSERASFLPFTYLSETRTWNESAYDGAVTILSKGNRESFNRLQPKPFKEPQYMHILRIQIPQTLKFITRLIYLTRIDQKVTSKLGDEWKCCQNTKRMKWVPIEDISNGSIGNFWGPELTIYSRMVNDDNFKANLKELGLNYALRYVPRDVPRNLEEEMLKSVMISERDIERVYLDFLQHSYPSQYMTLTSFSEYMSKFNIKTTDGRLFNAFNFMKNGFLSFHEFLLGLGCYEMNSVHKESRVKFVFRYYDLDSDGFLSYEEISKMIMDMNPKDDERTVNTKVRDAIKVIGSGNNTNKISFDDFIKSVGSLKFRGTSSLVRSKDPLFNRIITRKVTSSIQMITDLQAPIITNRRKYKGICPNCRSKKHRLACHIVKYDSNGRITEPNRIQGTETDNTEEVKMNVRYSMENVFNPRSTANNVIDMLRQFNVKKGSSPQYNGFMASSGERDQFLKILQTLCADVTNIFASEDRVVKVTSPAYVLGDIHGNIEDLLTYEKILWNSIPVVPSNYVFLGDYVDRGKWSVECALYVFCLKILMPDKFFFCRGNHEIRDIQQMFTFYRECNQKYGDIIGKKVWETINTVFDRLPIAMVIDETIFCSHGGIPTSVKKLEDIMQIPNELKYPESESPAAWEIMWNDPMENRELSETAELLHIRLDSARGFLSNLKRGTGYYFSEEALHNFLRTNGFTHVIRAHEMVPYGYRFQFNFKCITVFSCSHYCTANNEAACILIDNEKIRVLRLDTSNNAPAMDAP